MEVNGTSTRFHSPGRLEAATPCVTDLVQGDVARSKSSIACAGLPSGGSAGRPVVASAIGGIPEIVRDREEGLLVPPADAAALAQALELIIEDDELRERLAANARRRADVYSADAVLPELEAAYERVVSDRSVRQARARRSSRA